MKKGMRILIAVLSLILIFGAVSVSVIAADNEVTPVPYSEFDFDNLDEFGNDYSDDLNDIFDENASSIILLFIVAGACMLLFLPLVIVVIVFIVLNSKQKKKLNEYEMRYGYILEEPYQSTFSYNNMNNYQGGSFNE